MEGRAKLGQYGEFHLAANPKWRPVSTLDSSGRGHMHSLHYLLPLLRYGVSSGDRAMVGRFYFLIRDWARDNPPGGRTSRYAWGPPIYEGFRSLVLTCAVAGPRGDRKWLKNAVARHGRMLSSWGRYEGVNNASLHQSMGLYALGEAARRPAWRRTAIARMRSLAVRLIQPDGSDEEGALQYARNNHRWFSQAAERLRRGRDPVPAELDRVHQIPAFLAHATRPDGRLEALGDTSPVQLNPADWAGTPLEYTASLGASGSPPSSVFASFAGGYAFGRSGWGGARVPQDETYFSVRGGKATPHAHDDSGSVTLYAHGAPLLLDTGQWRYQYGTTRSFVVSRAAHNTVLVHGVRRTRLRPQLSAKSVGGLDIVDVVDTGYHGVTLRRTVAYDRADDVLLVWDRLSAEKRVRASQQWGLGRDREVSVTSDVAHTSGPGANVSLLFTSGGAPLDVAVGQRDPLRGWNSLAYGELSPSPSLRASQRGAELSWLTVIAPRAADVPTKSVSASAAVSSTSASVAFDGPNGSATVTLDGVGGSRTAYSPVAPTAIPDAGVVLAGTTTSVRATGLVPGATAEVQRQATDGTGLQTVGTAVATAAGTAEVSVPADASADYRVVGSTGASAWQRVLAAVSPAPVTDLIATAGPRGKVTVTWALPVDTGGAPLTRQVVRVDGERTRLDAGPVSHEQRQVVPGQRSVRVRTGNAVALAPYTTVLVDVPAYPTVTGPHRVQRRSTVRLQLHGLLPGVRATVTADPVRGKTVTRRPKARADGTATVRIPVRKHKMRVVAESGGVRSDVHRLRPRRR
jgi:hypothetical protein